MRKNNKNRMMAFVLVSALGIHSFSSLTNAADVGSQDSPTAEVSSETQETQNDEVETVVTESETIKETELQTETECVQTTESEVQASSQSTEESTSEQTEKQESDETTEPTEAVEQTEQNKTAKEEKNEKNEMEAPDLVEKGVTEYRVSFNNQIAGISFQTLTGSSSSACNVKAGYNFMFKVLRDQRYVQSRIRVYDTYQKDGMPVKEEIQPGSTGIYKISNLQSDHELSMVCENRMTLRMPNAAIRLEALTCLTESGESYELDTENISQTGEAVYQFYVPENARVQIRISAGQNVDCSNLQITEDGIQFVREELEDGSLQFTKKYGCNGCADYIVSKPDTYQFSVKIPMYDDVEIIPVGNSKTAGIAKGESFSFQLVLSEAYNQTIPEVKANEKTVLPKDGIYTISDVEENQVLSVGKLVKNTYKVLLPKVEGAQVETVEGYHAQKVTHGDSFKFTIKKQAGYSLSAMSVLVDGKKVTADASGVYTISNMTGNASIELKDIRKDMILTAEKTTLKVGEKMALRIENVPKGYQLKVHNCTPTKGILKKNRTLQGRKEGILWVVATASKGQDCMTAELKITIKKGANRKEKGTFSKNGIYYTVTKAPEAGAAGRVCVTCHPNHLNLSGTVQIPEFITYRGKRYKVTAIGEYAFCGSKRMQAIIMPRTIRSVGVAAFMGCKNLTDFRVDANNQHYSSDGAMLLDASGTTLVAYPGAAGKITINGKINTIGIYAMTGCRATSVTIGRKVKNIQPCAFANTGLLTKVVFLNKDSAAIEYGCIFDGVNEACRVYVPENSYGEYIRSLSKEHSSHAFHSLRTN